MAKFDSALELAAYLNLEGVRAPISLTDIASVDGLPSEVVGAFVMLEVANQFYDDIQRWVDETLEDDALDYGDEDAD